MSCTNPKMAIILGKDEEGKKILSFSAKLVGNRSYAQAQHDFGVDNVVLLPCGRCDACKLARRRSWALRCAFESKYHLDNCFVTLTYDNEHLPENPSKDDFKDFIKSLRNDGHKVRYFGCGEKGDLTNRSHLHIILFGFIPKDLESLGKSNSGMIMYESQYLNKLWNKGFVVVNEFDPACAGYVAGYTSKKLNKESCFILMSKRPGIGYQYFLDHKDKIFKYDNIVGDFGSIKKANIPRFFDKKLEEFGFDITEKKNNRLIKSHDSILREIKSHGFDEVEDTFFSKRVSNKRKIDALKRSL